MSKSITANLPGIPVLLDIYPLRRLGGATGWLTPAARRVWLEKLPFAALSLYALGFYLAKTLWPVRLSPLYELTLPVHPLEARFVAGALAVAAVTVTAFWLRRRWRSLLAA